MAEAAAVLGLISAIVQLIDFGTRVVNRLDEFNSAINDGPVSLQLIKLQLPLVMNTLQRIQIQAQAHSMDEVMANKLRQVVNSAFDQVQTLETILDKAVPAGQSSSFKKRLQALKSLAYDKKIQKCFDQLQNTLLVLGFHQASYQSEQIEQLNQGLLALTTSLPFMSQDSALRAPQLRPEIFTGQGPSLGLLAGEELQLHCQQDDTSPNQAIHPVQSTCVLRCSCKCHARHRITTPLSLRRIIGFSIIVFPGFLAGRPACSENRCLRDSKKLHHVAFYFPTWLLPRAWFFNWSVRRNNPQMSLKFVPIVPDNADIFQFAKLGNIEGVRSLISSGLASAQDLNASWGVPVLNFAVQGRHLELCKYLLVEGAEPNTENTSSISALDIAWTSLLGDGLESVAEKEKLRRIFSLFSDSDWIDEQQFSPLHMILFGLNGRNLNEELSISTSMINLPDSKGRTPLSWAAQRGDHLHLRTLLLYGADPNIGCITGNSPLLRAARARSPDGIPVLLNAGARLDWTSKQKFTALHYAAYYQNHGDYLIPFLERGADVDALDSYGWTPLACTTEYDNSESAAILLRYGAKVNVQCHDGWTPLLRSINSNSHQVLKLLLDSGADHHVRSFKGETILHFAARRGNPKTMQLIANARLNDLDVEAKSVEGYTAKDLLELRKEGSPALSLAFEKMVKTQGSGELRAGT